MGRGKKNRNRGQRPLGPPEAKRLGRGPRPAGLGAVLRRLRAAQEAAAPPPRVWTEEDQLQADRAYHQRAFQKNPVRRFRVEGEKLLFQRLGHLNPVRQDKGFAAQNAPERRGIWAFPWPAGDIGYFAGHKWDEVLPKRLRSDELERLWVEMIELDHTSGDRQERERREQELEALREERERWIRDQGPKALPLRRFWLPFTEEIYCHLDHDGRYLSLAEWRRTSVSQFLEAARRSSPANGTDQFEIFLPRR